MRHNRHSNISVFIPHQGCRNCCSFCNQRTITGQDTKTAAQVSQQLETAMLGLKNDCDQTEIAFFGGSFTAIDPEYMLSLLQIGKEFVDRYSLHGIRISTRPDCIDDEILDTLKKYGVTAIELGAQSMSERVLKMNRRGHSAQDVVDASNKIKAHGFELGLQMMVGLYGDTEETVKFTAEQIISIHPDTVRIYPTVVLKGTHLAQLVESGEYKTFSLDEAVMLCSQLLSDFISHDIRVIKLGLHSSQDVVENMVAGIYHPAFRELCESKLYLKMAKEMIAEYIAENGKPEKIQIIVSPSEVSKMTGHKRENIKELEKTGIEIKIVASEAIVPLGGSAMNAAVLPLTIHLTV